MPKSTECRNFVIAGHAGCGKTTLSELMLYKSGVIGRPGTIDGKNTVSDFMLDEQERRSSIYSACMNCTWKDNQFFFVDIPGYAEFMGQGTAAVRATDAGLVVIDAIDGPQVGTAQAWKMVRNRKIPRFALVNRIDKDRADFKATLEAMRNNHGKGVIIPLYWPVGSGESFSRVVNVLLDKDIPAEIADDVEECRGLWLDAIAETDDELMMRYLDGEQLSDEEILTGLKKAVKKCSVIPVFAGSSLKDIGITELMDAIVELFPTPLDYVTVDGAERKISDDADALGIVFKSVNDPFIGQLAYVRTVSGVFKGDSDIWNLSRSGVKERIGSMFFMNGKSQSPVREAGPGCIFTVAKFKDTHIGDTISANSNETLLPGIEFPEPVMSYAVSAQKSGEDEKIATGLHKIIECMPTVRLARDEQTHELLLSGMGDQQLATVTKRLKEQFKVEAVLSTPKVPYRETITGAGEGHYRHKKQTGGAGQFAEVSLKIAYSEDGYEFSNDVVGGAIPKNFIPAVEKGILDMLERGPLVGCPVERVKVSVFDGKYHPVDSNEMAFRIAGRMAFKEAMGKAQPVLLEPIMHVEVHIPDAYMGDITGDLNHKRGRILGMEVDEGMQVVMAEVPLAEMPKYATELRSMTQGRGTFEMKFERYEPVPSNLAAEISAKYHAENDEA